MGKLTIGAAVLGAAFLVAATAVIPLRAHAELPAPAPAAAPALRYIEQSSALQFLWTLAVQEAQADQLGDADKADLTKAAHDAEQLIEDHKFDQAEVLLQRMATLLVERSTPKTHA